MLLLCFSTGERRFAIDASCVIEVVPMVRMEAVPKAPDYVAGIMRYHGVAVPVVDLTMLNLGRPSSALLSTRIMLVRHPMADGAVRTLGIIAEHMSETVRRDPDTFVSTGVAAGEAAYLGRAYFDSDGMVHLVDAGSILSGEAEAILFRNEEEDRVECAL